MGGKRKNSGSSYKVDESGSKRSDDCDSQEELDGLDGSTPKWNTNGVRYSARVMEKQEKLRRESSPAKQIVGDCSGQNPLSSNSSPPGPGWKTGMKFSSDDPYHSYSEHGQSSVTGSAGYPSGNSALQSSTGNVSDEKQRKKRNWELWSQDDKQLFFEALNDYGKDFDAIQNHLASKLRPKNKLGHSSTAAPVTNHFIPKNKDQVRHFYYRTWNKISKFLTFPKDMKKAFQELYGLVNYGELRKKQRVLNLKTAAKLSELVEKGTTAIKVRGKTFRIKTPVCRALKRLNRLDDVEHARVPCKVCLELIAKDGTAWAAVQGVSHNPRVKVHVPLQRTLASVISYFEDRWKSSSDKLKEQLLHTFGKRAVPRLRFIPADKRDMNLPIFKVSEVTSSAKLSLRAFTEKVLKETDKIPEVPLKSKKKQGPCNPDDSVTEPESDFDPMEATPTAIAPILKSTSKLLPLDPSETLMMTGLEPPSDKTLSPDRPKVGSDGPFYGTETSHLVSKQVPPSEQCICPPPTAKGEEDFLSHVWEPATLQKGWTVDDAGTMTCGELYLLLGQSDKLCFQYYWDNGEESPSRNNTGIKLIDRLVEVARLMKKRKTLSRPSKSSWPIACAKCGHKTDSPWRAPTAPTNTHASPGCVFDPGARLIFSQTPNFAAYNESKEIRQVRDVPTDATGMRINSEALGVLKPSEVDQNAGQFRRPRSVIPKDSVVPTVIIPPKPFLDLPKGNRRIGRPVLKRVVVPRVLPLTPKGSDMGAMYTISIPGSTTDLTRVSHTSVVASSVGANQSPVAVADSFDGQKVNLLNCLNVPAVPAENAGPSNTKTDNCISVGCNEFEDLLKVRQDDKLSVDPENSFSLSSFMDISLPESSRLAASVCLNSDKFLSETTEQSQSCSLGLSNFLDNCTMEKDGNDSILCTPVKTLENRDFGRPSASSEGVDSGPWMASGTANHPSDLSLSSILGTLDVAIRNDKNQSMTDVNFQSVIGEGDINFLTKYSERATSKLNNTTKDDESS